MSIKRRLLQLENRPFRRPIEGPKHFTEQDRALQKRLCLPLPDDATDEEQAKSLELLIEAQRRIRIDRGDTGGCDRMREYSLSLHRKHGTEPMWGTDPIS